MADDELRRELQDRWDQQHSDLLRPDEQQVKAAYKAGCGQCLEAGSAWVHLRMCLVCGRVGCCDSSPQTHARRHWEETGHAVIRTLEPGEDWIFSFELGGYLTGG